MAESLIERDKRIAREIAEGIARDQAAIRARQSAQKVSAKKSWRKK